MEQGQLPGIHSDYPLQSIDTHQRVIRTIVSRVEQQSPDWEIEIARRENRRARCYKNSSKSKKAKSKHQLPDLYHGIDYSKLTPSSMFYLPAQCGDEPSASFFTDYDDIQRVPLDPSEYDNLMLQSNDEMELEVQYLHQQMGIKEDVTFTQAPSTRSIKSTRTTQQIIESTMAEYRSVPDSTGRHRAFFRAIYEIHHKANVSLDEIEPYMIECDYDGHQRSRNKRIISDLRGKYQPNRTQLAG